MDYFRLNYENIRYPYSQGREHLGLRNAQIGAIHAIGSFFTLVSNENAAIIVMPTGSGKTSVIMISPYILRAGRVLIVTPSTMVRSQIADEFRELLTLKKIHVLDDNILSPVVFEMCHQYNESSLEDLDHADVIVATPQVALSLSETSWAKENIDLVEIDEAHHTPAKTWQQILINCSEAKQILFTATPFRLDKKEIKGDIVYNYPLSRAYADGIFGEIKYLPVNEVGGEENDITLAKQAEKVLTNDRELGYKHYLMARVQSKDRAKLIDEIYSNYTSLKLQRVDSSMTSSKVKLILKALKEGELDGIICVDMLGEGFDFPNLKIAAIHDPQKSLANTLQFIGRFARTNAANIGTAKFLAIPNEDFELENRKLYASDSCWQDLIIDLSENRNREEQEKKEYFKNFESDTEHELDNVPLQSINFSYHAKIYRVDSFDFDGEFPTECKIDNRIYRNEKDNTVIGIGISYDSPKWLSGEMKINKEYSLYIVHYQVETKLLFIYSQQHSESLYEQIASGFSNDFEKIERSSIHHILGKMDKFEIFNSGMANLYDGTGEAYRILAGSDVGNAIDPNTGRLYSAGHVFCKATDHSTGECKEVTLGYSSASKIWSSQYTDIPGYVLWCDLNGKKIVDSKIKVVTHTNFDCLPIPEKFNEYPNNVFVAEFDSNTYVNAPNIYVELLGSYVALTDFDLRIISSDKKHIEFAVMFENKEAKIEGIYSCDTSGKYMLSGGTKLYIGDKIQHLNLEDYFNEFPITFRTTDFKNYYGFEMTDAKEKADAYDYQSNITGIDWKKMNTDITTECGRGKRGKLSIQETIEQMLLADSTNEYVIFDHGTGEIADYITIKVSGNGIKVALYHAKGMKGATYNNSVSDIYEVTGQAIKSLIWFSTRGRLVDKMRDRKRSGRCIMKRGDFSTLVSLLTDSSFQVRGEVIVVQPGLSKGNDMPDKLQEVLASADTYIRHSGKMSGMKIWGSN